MEAKDNFPKKASTWNKLQFGNIFSRKKNIIARLNGIQRVVYVKPSTFLLNLKKELMKELDIILRQEEEFWALKSS